MDISIQEIRAAMADPCAAIARAEETYRASVAALAARLLREPSHRILFLAGPSSSGKTTTANILCDYLQAAGHTAAVVSLDNFYRPMEDPDYPRLASGAHDFESPDAIDIAAVRACLAAVLRGEEYPLPRFDFRRHVRDEATTPLRIPEDGYLIIEGLHALNPRLSEGLPEEAYLCVFISVSTNIVGEDGSRLLSGRKLRFVRRLVRDSLYRASDAARTYELWQSVLAGEDAYLYPYRHRADVTINSFHLYEVALLRPFAEPLLEAENAPRTDYIAAVRAAMAAFAPLSERLVPTTSLLREFIPGGVYESVY
jgi:uridine kinase